MANAEGYRFRDKVLDPNRRMVVYEFVPPEWHTALPALRRSARTLVQTLVGFPDVDAVYVPQVIEEEGSGSSTWRPDRVPARQFASHVRKAYMDRQKERERRGDPPEPQEKELIVSEIFPYLPREQADEWLVETGTRYRIGNVVVVGASKERRDFPGYRVAEAAGAIQRLNGEGRTRLFAGGIAMDLRRRTEGMDEPARMVEKTKAGIQYFFTQIWYDPGSMIRLLQDYCDECDRQGTEPRRVFLGLSPISSEGTLRIIEDLRRTPVEDWVKERIFQRTNGKKGSVGNRSIEQIEEALRRVFDYAYRNRLAVPLGVCVEHVTESNFRHTYELLQRVPELWKEEYHPDSDVPY